MVREYSPTITNPGGAHQSHPPRPIASDHRSLKCRASFPTAHGASRRAQNTLAPGLAARGPGRGDRGRGDPARSAARGTAAPTSRPPWHGTGRAYAGPARPVGEAFSAKACRMRAAHTL